MMIEQYQIRIVRWFIFTYVNPSADPDPEPMTRHEARARVNARSHIRPKSELVTESDQVREPAPTSVPVGIMVEIDGMEWSPAHIPTEEGLLFPFHPVIDDDIDDVISQSLPSELNNSEYWT